MSRGQKGRGKKPAIPREQRTKGKLQELEGVFSDLLEYRRRLINRQELLKQYRKEPQKISKPLPKFYGGEEPLLEVEEYYDALEECRELTKKLVRLDNTQLHHPFVQFLLEGPRSKDFLRWLHRGLEKDVKRGPERLKGIRGDGAEKIGNISRILGYLRNRDRLSWVKELLYLIETVTGEKRKVSAPNKERALQLSNFPPSQVKRVEFLRVNDSLVIDFCNSKKKPMPLSTIQRCLVIMGLIKKMKYQNFHKLTQKLLSDVPGPFYDVNALPPRPKKIPPEWSEAQRLLQKHSEILQVARW